uniref:Secreted protein n=1 Tax=Steinernema glaseri TaxID=37863 RepID=A0A1I8AHP9_9BILA
MHSSALQFLIVFGKVQTEDESANSSPSASGPNYALKTCGNITFMDRVCADLENSTRNDGLESEDRLAFPLPRYNSNTNLDARQSQGKDAS